jgi:hypothetical protein
LEQGGNPINDSSAEPSGLNRTIRWIARGWSIASIGFVLLILVGELVYPHAPAPTEFRDLLGLFLFPFCTCLGMILAWRWEGLGGTITIGSLLAFYAALRIMDGRFPGGPFFALVAAPGLLFLFSWTLGVARIKDNTA